HFRADRLTGLAEAVQTAQIQSKESNAMLRASRYFIMAAIFLCLAFSQVQAKDLKVSLPLIPPLVESKDKGILVDLVKAMADEYKDGKITWDVFPFPRSLENVEKGRADFHMPYIKPVNPEKIPFQYS